MYQLSNELVEGLSKANIKYAHWKSNLFLDEALSGYDDLDLLIHRNDILNFELVLLKLGFIEASNRNISFSSVKHFYGHDEKSGNILHLHVYYQIKTGPSWTKPYRFDFEEYLLSNLTKHKSGMSIPGKHIELVIFIFRTMLKYSKINEFILINREHSRNLKEIEYLTKNLDQTKLECFLKRYFPNISKEDILNYIDIIKTGSNINKFIEGKSLRNKLKKYNYMSYLNENLNNIIQFFYRLLNKLLLKEKKIFHTSGMFLVVVGLDATGKTTITNELKRWLGKNLTTRIVHFGKPPSSLLTLPFNLIIKLLKKSRIHSELKSSIKKDNKQSKSLLYILRQVILSYDRYRLVKNCWNRVSVGELIICDRYKSENYDVMDSKRLNPIMYTGLKNKLAKIENYYYDQMPIPDILFYLTVSVNVAIKRNEERIKKGKETTEFIIARHQQNQNLSYKSKNTIFINTERKYDEVIKEIKKNVWHAL